MFTLYIVTKKNDIVLKRTRIDVNKTNFYKLSVKGRKMYTELK